jgi:hypothetical protein
MGRLPSAEHRCLALTAAGERFIIDNYYYKNNYDKGSSPLGMKMLPRERRPRREDGNCTPHGWSLTGSTGICLFVPFVLFVVLNVFFW